jgi:hypothetical protein
MHATGATPSRAIPRLGSSDPRALARQRWTTLPPDVMRGVRERVVVFAAAVAVIWAIILVMNDVVAPLVGHHHTKEMGWPWPGTALCGIGLISALATWIHTRRKRCDSSALINVALLFQVVTAALISLETNWTPYMLTPRVSPLCIVILTLPAIVPAPPIKTLAVSLLIATMDPISIWIAHMRQVPMAIDPFMLIWYFLPTYISVGLAVLASMLISGLGRRVQQARELGSYQLGERIGLGGMGEVYRARHRLLARPAAIKLIRPEALAAGGESSRAVVQRFHREAQAAALLRSPHTIGLYDFGMTDTGTFYYVMELLDGFDLETLVRRFGPLPPERVISFLRQACRSLGEAHAQGLVHRDVKPSNIFSCRMGLNVDFIKVLDFGLVKMSRANGDAPGPTVLLTQPDVTTGTPAYMPPEMALGEGEVDGRADLYALGCVGYWLLTGRLVFEADTPVKMMLKHIQEAPVAPSVISELGVPPELDAVVLRLLAKKPDDRYADATELARALEVVPVRERWTTARAERWWNQHHPAPAPVMELRPPTPAAEMHAMKAGVAEGDASGA